MHILGINAYHAGASACLIRDGELVAAAEEERFRRIKYWSGFPVHAIRYCLEAGGIQPADLDHIGISRDPKANFSRKVIFALRHQPSLGFIRERLMNAAQVRDPKSEFCRALGVDHAALKATAHNVEHHRAHMASAFFVSPFENAAVLSVDGAGDFVSTMWGAGRGNKIEVRGAINYPHSLGIFYTAVSQWLGFPSYGDEGKVMGLAPYGRPVHFESLQRVVRLHRDGTFELDLDFFRHHAQAAAMTFAEGEPALDVLYSSKLENLLGPPRAPADPITEQHQDVAASLQAMLECAEMALVRRIQRDSGATALCLAGGVALNGSFNGKILRNTDFTDIFIQPAANDAGTALGVAYYIHHQILDQPRRYVMRDSYTGPAYTDAQIAAALRQSSFAYKTLDERAMTREVARLIAEGKVVGWFQGRMEWGPRALGNRSILADPRRLDMKDILNARIKRREPFRPFAPSIALEAVGDYFDQTYPDPFMLKIYEFLPERQVELPAVTHVDGTGRLQTVDREAVPLYWQLIDEVRHCTGHPVVLNTSFNENEPIVCSPTDAIECFKRTRMDALALGHHLVQRD